MEESMQDFPRRLGFDIPPLNPDFAGLKWSQTNLEVNPGCFPPGTTKLSTQQTTRL
ncbi:MAG: hypothetical protein QME64_04485 [bacterium]|nr:hypothetical protein [bacterium]